MKLFLTRLKVYLLYGGKKKFLEAVNTSLVETTHKRDLVLSFRNTLSDQRILDSDVNGILNDTQAQLELDIADLEIVLENES